MITITTASFAERTPLQLTQAAANVTQLYAQEIHAREPELIQALASKVIAAIAFASDRRDHRDFIIELLMQASPEIQTLVCANILGQMLPPDRREITSQAYQHYLANIPNRQEEMKKIHENLSAIFSPEEQMEIAKTFFQNLSPEERIELLNNLAPFFPDCVNIAAPPRQPILPATYAKLTACAALTGALASQLLFQTSIKKEAAAALIPLSITLAPLIFGFRKTERTIEKLGNGVKSVAATLTNHLYNKRKYYVSIAVGTLLMTQLFFMYKSFKVSPMTIEINENAQNPILPGTLPPVPQIEPEIELPELKIQIVESPQYLNQSEQTPFLDQTIKEVLQGTIAKPICELAICGTKTIRLAAEIFGRFIIQAPDMPRFAD